MLSSSAQRIFEMKYAKTLSNGRRETWQETVTRVADYVSNAEANTVDKYRVMAFFIKAMYNRDFIPGGRILANAGTGIKNMFNCVSGETFIHTKDGLYPIKELVGKDVSILTEDGKYRIARFNNYGKQKLYEIIFKNGDILYATADHEWIVTKRKGGRETITTLELSGRMIPYVGVLDFVYNEDDYIEGVRHGLVFGDGTKYGKNKSQLLQFGDSKEVIPRFFDRWVECKYPNDVAYVVTGLPGFYKFDLPNINYYSKSYIRGFIAGLVASDGHVDRNGHVMFHNHNLSSITQIRNLCSYVGLPTTSIRQTRFKNPYNGEESEMWKLSFVKKFMYANKMIIMEKHRKHLFSSPDSLNIKKEQTCRVISVKETDRIEDVFCCVEPETHTMVINNCYLTKQCFVLPIEDSRQSIYKTLQDAAELFAHGGGVGYNFSNIRATGSLVKTTGGKASGPLSFMSLFDQTGEVISQASRRGAQMGLLNIEHLDIIDFIQFKNKLNSRNKRLVEEYLKNLKSVGLDINSNAYFNVMRKTLSDDQLTHFNLSVAISDLFMTAVLAKTNWFLGKYRADEILDIIAVNAWENGDPGIFFIDRANQDSLAPYLGRIDATNPCGEVPLLPYEACCLGSINLYNFVENKDFDWDYFKSIIRIAVRFLDNVQTLNKTPLPEINKMCHQTRRLGLGVMGLADCLVEMEMPYDSIEALDFCTEVSKFLGKTCWEASMDLAKERGSFPAFDDKNINWSIIDKFDLPHNPVRNIAVTSIAPTGTIALIADVNSGIEPYFSLRFKRNITTGLGNTVVDSIQYEIPLLQEKRKLGWSDEKLNKIFRGAHQIHWKDHIKMQSVWQAYTDNAVSKTINMPYDITVDDIKGAYILAWESGLKGMTIYRDQSKLFQILENKDRTSKQEFGLAWN